MKPYHYILIHHETFSLGDDFICCFITSLGVERTQNHTSGGIILQKRILMCLYATFGKLSVQVIWHSGSLVEDVTVSGCFLLHFSKFLEFVLLNHICKFLPYQF